MEINSRELIEPGFVRAAVSLAIGHKTKSRKRDGFSMNNHAVNRRWFGGLPFVPDTRPLFRARSF